MKEYIEQVIAPKLQGDGGWIDYNSYQDGILSVTLQGECSKCHIADRCIHWIEQQIEQDLGVTVKIQATRKRPFFWDI